MHTDVESKCLPIRNLIVSGPFAAIVNGRTTVVGVDSFGDTSTCDPTSPTGFASVTDKMDWILQNSDAGDYQCPPFGKKSFSVDYQYLKILQLSIIVESC